jgi:hypothetical protein
MVIWTGVRAAWQLPELSLRSVDAGAVDFALEERAISGMAKQAG